MSFSQSKVASSSLKIEGVFDASVGIRYRLWSGSDLIGTGEFHEAMEEIDRQMQAIDATLRARAQRKRNELIEQLDKTNRALGGA